MIHLTITGPYMACPIWATDSLDNEYSTFSVLMGERGIFHLNIPVTDSASREPDGFTYLKLPGDLFVNEEPASKSVKSQKTLLVMLSPQEGEAIDSDRIMAYLNHIHFVDSPKWEEQPEDELHYHAPYGFLNDPNGFTNQNGQWILYHQHNPMDRQWQNMSWGSSYSTDGLHYHFRGDVLLPDRSGSSFSGCSLLNERGLLGLPKDAILFFYTYAGRNPLIHEGKKHKGDVHFTQRLAYSLDGGETLLPYPAFELAEYTRENRDPKILWHEASKSYIMVLFLEANAFAILRSTDLLHWEKTQEFSYPPMWECPDLFCLRRGEEEVWAFTSADGFYYLGSFDGREFHEIQEMQSLFDTKGVSPYASQTAFGTDGRIVQISWLRTENHGELWNGLMSIPREFTLGGEEGSYYIKQEFIWESSSFTKEIDGRTVISDRLARESLDAEGRILHVDQSF
ncbi:MAG: glycoside hydrolase family 32 protein [Lachnospiraceae bacterium]|nr:glycoside hydrolase family 32 protein [Lachnospiraceae bacterium]